LIRLTQQLNIRELIAGDVNKFKGPGSLPLLNLFCFGEGPSGPALLLRRARCPGRWAQGPGVADGLDALANVERLDALIDWLAAIAEIDRLEASIDGLKV
jgi:hypothetical protein